MAILYCILFILANLLFVTNAKEFICNKRNFSYCLELLDSSTESDRLILNPQIEYELSESYTFPSGKQRVAITSASNAVVRVERGEGQKVQVIFRKVDAVLLENISFVGSSENKFKNFYTFLTINNSKSVNITGCVFHNIFGLALDIHSNTNGDFSLLVNRSTFVGTGNCYRPSQGVYLGLNYTGNVSVSVTHSNFTNFKTNESSFLSYTQRIKYRPLALEQASNYRIPNAIKVFNVSDCRFEDNEAYVGGGLGLYTSHSSHSYFNVSRCLFRNNKVINSLLKHTGYNDDKHSVEVIGSGGGIAGLFFNCGSCNLTIINCTLLDNTAVLGGGIKIGYYFKSPRLFINVYECSFVNNTANSGSGLYIESQLVRHSIPKPAWLRNLEFWNNTATGFGAGIFVAYLPLMLKGRYLNFYNNVNTSFAVISSQVEVYTDLMFKNNSGQRGGALFLSDNSQLLLNQSVNLYFENNYASEMGGAIYADSISLDLLYRDYGYTFYNVHCFIKHFIKFDRATPESYTQNITFKNNSAHKGAAIYTHTLSPCSWYLNEPPYSNITHALRWKSYSYINDKGTPPNYRELIATAVAHYTISRDNATLYRVLKEYNQLYRHHSMVNITVQPGIDTLIYFVATDQLGSFEVSIATVQPQEDSKVKPCNIHGDESIFLTSSNDKSSTDNNRVQLSFCGNPGESGVVLFKSLDGLTIEMSVNVTLEACPEGMFLNGTTCSCYTLAQSDLPTYREEITSESLIYLPWITNTTEKTFVQMSCPNSYCNVSKQQKYDKSHHHCSVNVSNSSECFSSRKGIGCTRCSHELYSGTLSCGRCSAKRTALSTVGVVLLLLIVIAFIFLIRASSYLNDHIKLRAKLGPYARSFIFFCQGLFILYLNVTPDNVYKYHTLSSFAQFISKTGFFFTYDQCFSLGLPMSSRAVVFEEYLLYVIGFISIFLIMVFFNCVLSRCTSIKLNPSVLVYVLMTYGYLTYAPIAYTTLRLISCGYLEVYSSTTGKQNATHLIWLYNATQTCMGTNGDIAMTSIAILTGIFYVIPLPLLFIGFSLVVKEREIKSLFNQKVFKRRIVKPHIHTPRDLSKVKRVGVFIRKISNGYIGCFSDPHFGFWIPITMITHLLLLIIQTNGTRFLLTNDKQAQYLAVICFLFLYIRVSLKITKDIYVQFYESISIFCLCLACIFLIINDNLSNVNQPSGNFAFQTVLDYFPLVAYITLFFSIMTPPAIKYCVNKYSPATPDAEETAKDSVHASNWEPDSEELDEQTKPLIENDPLTQMNDLINSTQPSPLARHINMGNMSHSDAYSDRSNNTGSPGFRSAFRDVNMLSMELSNANQSDD